MNDTPIAALAIAEQAKRTTYPEPFASVVQGRIKRRLGEHFGLTHYGVNLTQLAPGAASALLHSHALEDELVYIVSGTPVLIIDTAAAKKPQVSVLVFEFCINLSSARSIGGICNTLSTINSRSA